MLPFPESGVSRSVNVHNSDIHIFCDWIEGSMLFTRSSVVSRTDIVDLLCEGSIYDDQDFANEWLDDAWSELQRRSQHLGRMSPFSVDGRVLTRHVTWKSCLPYSFCILALLLRKSPAWRPLMSASERSSYYAKQGSIFERISEEALACLGWTVHRTGWSSDDADQLSSVVESVSEAVGQPVYANWSAPWDAWRANRRGWS